MVRRSTFVARAGVLVLGGLLLLAALHCGPPPALPEAPTPAAPPPASAEPAAVLTTSAAPVATAPRETSAPAVPRPPLVVARGCLAREGVEGDVQARMKDAWKAAHLLEAGKTELEGEGSRKLSVKPLADLDGDGAEEITLADEGTGTYNQLIFLYVSKKGCWTFSHVTMAAAYIVPKAAGKGPRDLGVVQKSSSCNDPNDRDGYTVTTLRAGKDGWTKGSTTTCPCATPKGKEARAGCDVALP